MKIPTSSVFQRINNVLFSLFAHSTHRIKHNANTNLCKIIDNRHTFSKWKHQRTHTRIISTSLGLHMLWNISKLHIKRCHRAHYMAVADLEVNAVGSSPIAFERRNLVPVIFIFRVCACAKALASIQPCGFDSMAAKNFTRRKYLRRRDRIIESWTMENKDRLEKISKTTNEVMKYISAPFLSFLIHHNIR